MRFKDIPQFTPFPNYHVHQSWRDINHWLGRYIEEYQLDIDPDFQRGHVWSEEQQIAYVEFGLRGGASGQHILTNHPNWMGSKCTEGPFQLVDGKQRLTAVRAFINNEITAFGSYYNTFEDRMSFLDPSFILHVNTLKTRAEVLQWYLEINSGGVVHTEEELARVRKLLIVEIKKNGRIGNV